MTRNYRYLFGPVPSRRFGRSLGVDLTPHKTCSFDCIFCQLGRTTNKTLARKEYVPTSSVIEELHDWLGNDGHADYVTLAGSGEPTLHSRFGEVIDFVRSTTTIPVALLTNGSMLLDAEVRQAAVGANVVKVSLSAWDQYSFEHINRPHPKLTLKSIVDGIWKLRELFSGELWIEVFIVSGVNSAPKDATKIAELIGAIQPDRIQLNTAVRPPAEGFVQAVPQEHLAKLAKLLGPSAEVIADFSTDHSKDVQANEQTILAMLARRPCTAEQIAKAFGMHRNEVSKYIGKLTRAGQIHAQQEAGCVYYLTQNGETGKPGNRERKRVMTALPEEVKTAWDNREGAIILTTVDETGIPNSIYATCVKRIADGKLVVADNYFSKTRANILAGSPGSLLFITTEGKAYQVKGSLAYCKEGSVFDDMKEWLDPKFPGVAATILTVEQVYSGAERLA